MNQIFATKNLLTTALFYLLISSVVASEEGSKPFVTFDEPVASYLKRIQLGEQKFKFNTSIDFYKLATRCARFFSEIDWA